jgi:predicted small metal-binding protein
MEACSGLVVADTDDELWQLIELHARVAHDEDPAQWSTEDRQVVADLITPAS